MKKQSPLELLWNNSHAIRPWIELFAMNEDENKLVPTTVLTSQADAPFPSASGSSGSPMTLNSECGISACAIKGRVGMSSEFWIPIHAIICERKSWSSHEDELSRCIGNDNDEIFVVGEAACFFIANNLHQNKDNLVLTDYSLLKRTDKLIKH